jgi:predicted nucleic acid-binding protein
MSRPRIELPHWVFVDTSGWYAVADPRDASSTRAKALLRYLAARRCQLFTSNFVVAELHALLIARADRHVARQALLDFDRSRLTTVVRAEAGDEERAKAIITQYDDKDFSLTDAISFAVMERLGIDHAFALDHHFAQYGWVVLQLSDEA